LGDMLKIVLPLPLPLLPPLPLPLPPPPPLMRGGGGGRAALDGFLAVIAPSALQTRHAEHNRNTVVIIDRRAC
jgi:hypothetical protein